MTVNKLYKRYINNNLTDILDDDKIIDRLVIKFEEKIDSTKDNDASIVNIILKRLILPLDASPQIATSK